MVANLPKPIIDPCHIQCNVDDWLVYFPQAKQYFQCGDIYTTGLVSLAFLCRNDKILGQLVQEAHVWHGNWPQYSLTGFCFQLNQ